MARENVALRQQIAALERSVKRVKIDDSVHVFWILMRRPLDSWRGKIAMKAAGRLALPVLGGFR